MTWQAMFTTLYTSPLGEPQHVSSQPDDECVLVFGWPTLAVRVILDARRKVPQADVRGAGVEGRGLDPKTLADALERIAKRLECPHGKLEQGQVFAGLRECEVCEEAWMRSISTTSIAPAAPSAGSSPVSPSASPNMDPLLGQDCSDIDIRGLPWER